MAGRAKSTTQKQREAHQAHNDLMFRAVYAYRRELAKAPGIRCRGARTICKDFEQINLQSTGKLVKLSYCTLIRLAAGGRSKAEANAADKSWLTGEEAEVVLSFTEETGNRGFPLSHRRLREHVNEILRARLGDTFPGVGKHWSHRFVEKHADRLKTSRSCPLDSKRGRAVNPNTHREWFSLLGAVLEEKCIDEDCIYAADEIGISPQSGMREYVIGSRKPTPQYQQRTGSRENITIIVTICADGTSIPPAVILKGNAYQMKWHQENPANASIGYSKKGWTDGEIGVEYIKDFDKRTKAKANGRDRLHIVDGHNSHYTLGFLKYARAHQIHVACYPSHATHVYQGLDVVVFAVLKKCWSEERDKWEREKGEGITKSNFVTIYGHAHLRALTPDLIRMAFRKTGVWPFDPTVISEQMMAPSKETSCQGHLPIMPSSPLRAVANFLQKLANTDNMASETPDDIVSNAPSESTTTSDVELLVQQLSRTSLSDLASTSPPTSETQLDHATFHVISPIKQKQGDVLGIQPSTHNEVLLLSALREAESANAGLKRRVIELQVTNVLNQLYCSQLRGQLANQEAKKQSKKKNGKLMSDGLPRLLSGDEFYERVVDHEKEQKRVADDKKTRREERERRSGALATWKRLEDERKRENNEQRTRYREAVEMLKKPVLGKLQPPVPRPRFNACEEDDNESAEDVIALNEDSSDDSDDER